MYKIMIIEDDPSLSAKIGEGLSRWGFNAIEVENFEDIMGEFAKHNPQLIIMDINLPFFDGFYWCNRIREISKLPIVFLSSRDTNMDIIMAVNMGGDDFITKPFSMDILMAKIHALLRRTYSYGENAGQIIDCKGTILNISDSTLLYNGEKVELTKNELKILLLLMKNRGKIISRERIMRILWDDDVFVNDNTLTVNINRLRNKLRDNGLKDFITTRKGQGYLIL